MSNEFSVHLGLVVKPKKRMENEGVKCPMETTTDQITGTDKQSRFLIEQLKTINNQLEEIKQTKPPEHLSVKSAASNMGLGSTAPLPSIIILAIKRNTPPKIL